MAAASDWSLHATKLHIIEHVLNMQVVLRLKIGGNQHCKTIKMVLCVFGFLFCDIFAV